MNRFRRCLHLHRKGLDASPRCIFRRHGRTFKHRYGRFEGLAYFQGHPHHPRHSGRFVRRKQHCEKPSQTNPDIKSFVAMIPWASFCMAQKGIPAFRVQTRKTAPFRTTGTAP